MLRIYIMNFLLAIVTTIGMTFVPLLITDGLGLSLIALGYIEGTTEFLSNAFRLTNGMLFDKIKNKRNLFVLSTSLAFMSKALLFLPSSFAVLFSKTLERIANGTFAAPRDAFVAGNAKNRGMALGLLNGSKAFGCVIGPLLVSISTIFFGPTKNNLTLFVTTCCLLAFPALLFSFTLKVEHVEEKAFSFQDCIIVCKSIAPILLLVFLFFLGRFNDGLLMMCLKHHQFPEKFYLATISIFNSIMLVTSPFIGSQMDKGYLKRILYVTIVALGIFNLCFYNVNFYKTGLLGWSFAILGLCAWGVQRAGAQIVFSVLVFKNVDKTYYGTAIGIFYIVSGLGTMLSAFGAGHLADKGAFGSVFLLSGFFALLSLGFSAYLLNRGALYWDRARIAHAT